MTVLYDLFSEERNRKTPISTAAVHTAALRRLERPTTENILPAIEAAARQRGATVELEARIGGTAVDAAIRFRGDLHLIVKLAYCRDEGSLLAYGEQFADLVRSIRREQPSARGLFVAFGAVNPQHLLTLDIARSEMDVLNAEAPDCEQQALRLTIAALDKSSEIMQPALSPAGEPPRAALSALREEINTQALEQSERADQALSASVRDRSLRANVGPDSVEVLRQKQEIDRRAGVGRFLSRERSGAGLSYLNFLLERPISLISFFIGIIALCFAQDIVDLFLVNYPTDVLGKRILFILTGSFRIGAAFVIFFLLIKELRLFTQLQRFRDFRSRVIEEEAARNVALEELMALRDFCDRSFREDGPFIAQKKIEEAVANQRHASMSKHS